jgi:hypothetical protein
MTHTAAKPNTPRSGDSRRAPDRQIRFAPHSAANHSPANTQKPNFARIVSGAFCSPPATGTRFRNLTRLHGAAAPLSGDFNLLVQPHSRAGHSIAHRNNQKPT